MLHILRAVADLAAEAEGDGQAPLCIAVCDAVGDRCTTRAWPGPNGAARHRDLAKTYTAAVLETPTSALHARLVREHLSLGFLRRLTPADQQALTCSCLEGRTVGGVGVSGRKPAEDEVLAGRLAAALLGEGGPTARD